MSAVKSAIEHQFPCNYDVSDEFTKNVYECALCGFLCAHYELFEKHSQKVHEKNFLPCVTCGAVFHSSKSLIEHIDSNHHGMLSVYRCGKPSCDFKTTVSKAFVFHLAKCIQSGFPCYYCQKKFSNPGSLFTHLDQRWQTLKMYIECNEVMRSKDIKVEAIERENEMEFAEQAHTLELPNTNEKSDLKAVASVEKEKFNVLGKSNPPPVSKPTENYEPLSSVSCSQKNVLDKLSSSASVKPLDKRVSAYSDILPNPKSLLPQVDNSVADKSDIIPLSVPEKLDGKPSVALPQEGSKCKLLIFTPQNKNFAEGSNVKLLKPYAMILRNPGHPNIAIASSSAAENQSSCKLLQTTCNQSMQPIAFSISPNISQNSLSNHILLTKAGEKQTLHNPPIATVPSLSKNSPDDQTANATQPNKSPMLRKILPAGSVGSNFGFIKGPSTSFCVVKNASPALLASSFVTIAKNVNIPGGVVERNNVFNAIPNSSFKSNDARSSIKAAKKQFKIKDLILSKKSPNTSESCSSKSSVSFLPLKSVCGSVKDSGGSKFNADEVLPKETRPTLVVNVNSEPCGLTEPSFLEEGNVAFIQTSETETLAFLSNCGNVIKDRLVLPCETSNMNFHQESVNAPDVVKNPFIRNDAKYFDYLYERKKSFVVIQRMSLSGHFFKCMCGECSYTCNSPPDFIKHFESHESAVAECAYCLRVFQDVQDLVRHSVCSHRRRIFQCSLCFYRACSKSHVDAHLQSAHSKLQGYVIAGTPVETDIAKTPEDPIRFLVSIKMIKCFYEDCSYSTNSITDIAYHVCKHPQRTFKLACTECEAKYSSVIQWIIHLRSHDVHLLHCLFCSYGCNKRLKILNHLVACHADYPLMTYIRTSASLCFILECYLNCDKNTPFLSLYNCSSPSTCYCYLFSCMEFEGDSNRIQTLLENVKTKKMHFKWFECLYCSQKANSVAKMEKHLKSEHCLSSAVKYYHCTSHPLSSSDIKELFDSNTQKEVTESDLSNTNSTLVENKFKLLTCLYCTHKTNNLSKLDRHVKLHHVELLRGNESHLNESDEPTSIEKVTTINLIYVTNVISRVIRNYLSFCEVTFSEKDCSVLLYIPEHIHRNGSSISNRIVLYFLRHLSCKMVRLPFFVCTYCTKQFRHLADLRFHWKNCHVSSGKKFSYYVKRHLIQKYSNERLAAFVDPVATKNMNNSVVSESSLKEPGRVSGDDCTACKFTLPKQGTGYVPPKCKSGKVLPLSYKRKSSGSICSIPKKKSKTEVPTCGLHKKRELDDLVSMGSNRKIIKLLQDLKIACDMCRLRVNVNFKNSSFFVKMPLSYFEHLIDFQPVVSLTDVKHDIVRNAERRYL